MSTVLDQMLGAMGATKEDFEARRALAKESDRPFSSKRGVQESAELDRILSLPRREWEDKVGSLVDGVSEFLRNPEWAKDLTTKGKPPMLRPIQVQSVIDMHDYGGLFGPQRVGSGKTLVTLISPTVLNAKKPLLLIPAKLIEKTRREMHAYRKRWLVPSFLRIVSYEILGRPQSAQLLEEYQPDLIIADEVHKLKNTGAAVTKRVKRYMEAHPETKMVALSGTITKRSLHDYAHISAWCLKGVNPTPRDFNTRMEWSSVLDERPREKEGFEARLLPGALIKLCDDKDKEMYSSEPQRAVRIAFRKRMVSTPGCVATQEGALGMSLSITSEVVPMPETAATEAVRVLRQDWERPDGEPVLDAIELWRHMRELACGFWYRWNPAAPKDWLARRKEWARAVREVLKSNRSGLDSESVVAKAVLEGYAPQHEKALRDWMEVRPTFKPRTEAVWVSYGPLKRAAKWMQEEKGIVWVEHVEFGQALAKVSGASFYQRGGVDQRGKAIEDHPPGTPMICSIASNSEGRNMQAWSTNLVVSPPTSGQTWEQMLGRTHRDGQEADEVSCHLLVSLREQAEAFERACRDARYISDSTGQEQKLCYADIDVVDSSLAPVLPHRG